MADKIDVLIAAGSDGLYDISIADDGDLETTEGFDTALVMSLFCPRRATAGEVSSSRRRRGWVGDVVSEVVGFLIGSKVWLFEQDRATTETEAGVADAARDGLAWLIEDSLLSNIVVDSVLSSNRITLSIELFRDASRVDKRFFDAWRRTGLPA